MSGCAQVSRDVRTTRLEDVLVTAAGKHGHRKCPYGHVLSRRSLAMTPPPVRRNGGRNLTVVNPTREFEDIYDRMGQLMNLAFGLAPLDVAQGPWVPLADLSETDDAYVVEVARPGVKGTRLNTSSRTGSWSSPARSLSPS